MYWLSLVAVFLGLCIVTESQLSQNDREKFLSEHNVRRQLLKNGQLPNQPQAASMPDLVWDSTLETSAQLLADSCIFGHDSYSARATKQFTYVGQNIAGIPFLFASVGAWFNEHSIYNYTSNSCRGICGHYTQIAWANTTNLGCGYKYCHSSNFPYGFYVVCNYGPAGNFNNQKPYEVAK
ncbi:hypothetical protein Ciccas_002878 [Cichlidogyrus casuarinus]|uniref:SCP domain-containing protein n=1 Tax=Cichlidogyrus casuarinus TaxID=1844966 RepID=A0ABD2QG06_9PLAT